MSTQKDRIIFLDYLRVFAIINVLLCHSTQAIYLFEPENVKNLSTQSRYMLITMFSCGRMFGVPLFLMITGYLLLGREYTDEKIIRFWKNSWLHLVICTMLWFLIYDIFLLVRHEQYLSLWVIVKDVLFLHRVNFDHVWYMPMIIGFYLLIPFASNAIAAVKNPRTFLVPIIVVFYLTSIIGFVNYCLFINGKELLDSKIHLGFSGGIYGLYMLFGYLFKQKWYMPRLKKIMLLIITLVSMVIAVILTNKMIYVNMRVELWYDSPFIVIGSVAIFVLAMQIRYPAKVVVWLSKYSFAVYLIHMLIKNLSVGYITKLGINKPMQVIVLEVVMLIGGYALAFLIGKIPKIGKYILYLK